MSITIINLSHPTKELKTITENWNDLPQELQNQIITADHYTLKPQSLLIYKGRQCIFDCMVSIDHLKSGETNWDRIVIQNCYDKNGLLYDYSEWYKTWGGFITDIKWYVSTILMPDDKLYVGMDEYFNTGEEQETGFIAIFDTELQAEQACKQYSIQNNIPLFEEYKEV